MVLRAVLCVIALPFARAGVNHFFPSEKQRKDFSARCRTLVIIPVRLHEMNLRSHIRTTAGLASVRKTIQEKGCDLKFRFIVEVSTNHTPRLAEEAKQHGDILSVPTGVAPSRIAPQSDRSPHEIRNKLDTSWTRWILSAMRAALKDVNWDWLLRMDSDAVVCSLNLVQLTKTLSRLLGPDTGVIAGDYSCHNSRSRPNNADEAFVLFNRASVRFLTESEHLFHPGSPAVMKKTLAMTLASYARLAYHTSFPLIEINLQEVVHIWTETRPDPSKRIFPDSAVQVCSRYIFYHIRTLMKEEALRTHLQDRSLFDPLHSGIHGYVPSFRADICEPGMGRTPGSDYRGLARDGYNATRYRLAFG